MKYPDGERMHCWHCDNKFKYRERFPELRILISKLRRTKRTIEIFCPNCNHLLKTIKYEK